MQHAHVTVHGSSDCSCAWLVGEERHLAKELIHAECCDDVSVARKNTATALQRVS